MVAAIFNIIIFGTGSAIYLFAVNLILSTASLAGWLQVVLIWLTGVVGWLLLRPYRRITQLGGKDSTEAVASAGRWHRLFMRDVRQAAVLKVADAGGTREPVGTRAADASDGRPRPESRTEDTVMAGTTAPAVRAGRPEQARDVSRSTRRGAPANGWETPDLYDEPAPSFAIYRPDSDRSGRDRSSPIAGRSGDRSRRANRGDRRCGRSYGCSAPDTASGSSSPL